MNNKNIALLVVFIGVAALLASQNGSSSTSDFELWRQKHGFVYSDSQSRYRETIFLNNLRQIQHHNSKEGQKYTMALNQFSAMSQEEFTQTYLTLAVDEQATKIDSVDTQRLGDVDWQTAGAVTHVKDQGACGSCWAFAAVGALEGLSKLHDDDLQDFSEQMLVDCAYITYGNLACNGGQMYNAFAFVKAKGIVHQDQYPYVAKKQACKISTGPYKISSWTKLNNCNDLANALVGRPISVAVDATNWSKYGAGIFDNCATQLNHGVLLTGVTDDYWMIKNSWSVRWGIDGYIKLARGNTCGVCNDASYPNA